MNVTTPIFRVSFPNLFEPQLNKLSGKTEYSVLALFKKGEDLSKLKKAALEAGIKKWGADTKKWPKQKNQPFRDQADMAKDGKLREGCEEGAVFMNFKNKTKPTVVDEKLNEVLDPHKVYAGCWARASVSAFAYSHASGNSGISFSLEHVQFVKDGPSLNGRVKVEDAFEPVEVADNASGADATDMFS